jgi:phosphatidylinositol alpha 1,6-mannosyltransferase
VRIAIVAESFLPQVNGVSNTVRHLTEQLSAAGHKLMVVAPGHGSLLHAGNPVIRVRSIPLPWYRDLPIGLPTPSIAHALDGFAPDVVHVAAPAVLGAAGLRAAKRLGLATVAVFQTDLVAYARQYGVRAEPVLWAWLRHVHGRAGRTLAPSTATVERLRKFGLPRVYRWGRGVNLDLFDPGQRDEALRRRLAPNGEIIVGYVGRVAAEKGVHRLTELADMPGSRLVIVGDGPARSALRRKLPHARFTGMLRGEELARTFASLDVFVHTGLHETFCQTVQEAQASGVPAIAPAVGGPLDLIAHGETGLLYRPDDTLALRRAVIAAVRDAELRCRLASAARAQARQHTWASVANELVDRHYAAVLPALKQAA